MSQVEVECDGGGSVGSLRQDATERERPDGGSRQGFPLDDQPPATQTAALPWAVAGPRSAARRSRQRRSTEYGPARASRSTSSKVIPRASPRSPKFPELRQPGRKIGPPHCPTRP